MTKKRLYSRRNNKSLILFLTSVISLIILAQGISQFVEIKDFRVFLFCFLISTLILSLGLWNFKSNNNEEHIFFDKNHLIHTLNGIESKIPFSSISRIYKPIFQEGENSDNWKIQYYLNSNITKEIRIKNYRTDNEFNEFINLVKQVNPRVEI